MVASTRARARLIVSSLRGPPHTSKASGHSPSAPRYCWLTTPTTSVLARHRMIRRVHRDVAGRHPALAAGAYRVRLADPELAHLPDAIGAGVGYTTVQTWSARIQCDAVEAYRSALLVVDESHWGEHASMFDTALGWALDNGVAVLGLTATPRLPEDSLYELAFSLSFHDLISLQ